MLIFLISLGGLLLLFCVPMGIYLLVCMSGAASVNHMSNAAKVIKPKSKIDHPGFMQWYSQTDEWALGQGFQRSQLFDMWNSSPPNLHAALWVNPQQREVLVLYFHANAGHYFDIVTNYSGGEMLTTGSSKDGALLPNEPTKFVQVFPGERLDSLIGRHRQARETLEMQKRLTPLQPPANVISLVIHELQQQINFVKSIPLWQLRIGYWYFVRRNVKAGKPIL